MLTQETESLNYSQAVARCIDKYGDKAKFVSVFSPSKINQYATLVDRCIAGTAPTIHVAEKAYGTNMIVGWLIMQLDYINNAVGADKKMNAIQMEELSRNILSNDDFQMLKVTDIMLFVHQFTSGKYGHFYGSVDAQVIGNALYQYKSWKQKQMALIHMTRHEIKEEDSSGRITYDEYQKLKKEQEKH